MYRGPIIVLDTTARMPRKRRGVTLVFNNFFHLVQLHNSHFVLSADVLTWLDENLGDGTCNCLLLVRRPRAKLILQFSSKRTAALFKLIWFV
jgi:hypothetical protein